MGICCSREGDYLPQNSSDSRNSKQARNSHYSFASILQSSGSDAQAVYQHPICLNHSIWAYEIHSFFEEALGVTFIPDSVKLRPHLNLIEPSEILIRPYHDIFSAVTVQQYLQDIEPYKSNKQETQKLLKKIDEILKSLLKKKPTFIKDKEEVIAEILFFMLMNFSEELVDLSPLILNLDDALTDLLEKTFQKLSNQKLEAILTPILTTFAKTRSQSVVKSHVILMLSNILSNIVAADPRTIDILVNHPHFLPNLSNHESIFGACINFTCFSDESQHVIINPSEPKDEQQKLLRESRDQVVGRLFNSIMQFMIKADSKYEKDIAKWFNAMLEFFERKLKGKDDLSEMVSYKGFFLNYLALLFKFLQGPLKKFEDYPALANQIDLTYIQQFPLAADQSLLNGKTHQLSSSNNSFSFQTQLVFIACHALGQYENFVGKYLSSNKNNFTFAAVGLISQMTSDDPVSFGFLTQALDDNLVNQIFRLICLQVLLIKRSFGLNLAEDNNCSHSCFDKNENQSSSFLPVYWLENMIDCLGFLRRTKSISLIVSQQQLGLVINFFFSVLQKKELFKFKDSNIIPSCLSFLSSLAPGAGGSTQLIPTQFITDFFMKATQSLLPALIRCFVDVEKTPEKYSVRVDCCFILIGLLREHNNISTAAATFDEISQTQNELCQKFVTYYLNDLMQLFEGLKKMNKIIEVEQRLQDGAEGFDLADLFVLLLDSDSVKGAIEYLKDYLLLGSHMTKCSPSFFLSDETKDKLALTLNYMLSEFLGKDAKIPLQPIQNLNYNPQLLLKNIFSIYLNFKDQGEFLREVVSDEQNFSVDFFKTIEGISRLLDLLDSEELAAWKKFVKDLEKTKVEKENEEKWMTEIQDVPEEYLDTLMNTVMKEPVMLPTSKVILDKRTICKHLLTDPTDPFNRNPLTSEMLIPQPELKQKIQDFVHIERTKNRGC